MTPSDYKAARESLGLTQEALAAILGCTRQTIIRREKGMFLTPECFFALEGVKSSRQGILDSSAIEHSSAVRK